ncbi:MAG: 5-methyltetrahydropteroyltriglutamate--homocysteine methyltransferase, partial [Pseudomonadota bacterium]
MGIQTTCIGAYPKPDYLHDNNWSETGETQPGNVRGFDYVDSQAKEAPKSLLDQATAEAIADQVQCGIDVPTDGEQRRENYIHYHCRHLEGIDFQHLTKKIHRNGAAVADLPTITGKIAPRDGHFLDKDYEFAQGCTKRPVKITVPGPITIMDTTADAFYHDDKALALDLATALNYEIRALAEAGCRHIQVDEPLFARNVVLA